MLNQMEQDEPAAEPINDNQSKVHPSSSTSSLPLPPPVAAVLEKKYDSLFEAWSWPKYLTIPQSTSISIRSPVKDIPAFMDTPEENLNDFIWKRLVYSRLCLFGLQILFNHGNFRTDAFLGVEIPANYSTFLDQLIQFFLSGFHRWDAIHMTHIATYGYVFENSLAFFPFFPLAVRWFTYTWAPPFIYFGYLHFAVACILSAVFINFFCFIAAGFLLFHVVQLLTDSRKHATIALLIFAVNPASIFYSAAYTESVFSMFTFGGIYLLLKPRQSFTFRYFAAVICFMLAYTVRSNGFLNVGYLIFYCVLQCVFIKKPKSEKLLLITKLPSNEATRNACHMFLKIILGIIIVWYPMYLHSVSNQRRFCDPASIKSLPPVTYQHALKNGIVIMGMPEKLSWCNESSLFPVYYPHVQHKYWSVGLFAYWQFVKIPCFLLATPVLVLVAIGVKRSLDKLKEYDSLVQVLASGGDVIPFALHTVVLAISGIFVYNVEVITRILFSSSPYLYIVMAQWIADATPQVRMSDLMFYEPFPFFTTFAWRGWKEALLLFYLLTYYITFSIWHIMFLPFT